MPPFQAELATTPDIDKYLRRNLSQTFRVEVPFDQTMERHGEMSGFRIPRERPNARLSVLEGVNLVTAVASLMAALANLPSPQPIPVKMEIEIRVDARAERQLKRLIEEKSDQGIKDRFVFTFKAGP